MVGCGPALEVEDPGGTSGNDVSESSSGSQGMAPETDTRPVSTTRDAATGDPDEPIDTTVDGEFFVSLPTIIAEATPLQFVGTINADAQSISMLLTPLSLDVLSVDTPRELVPPPIELVGTVGPGRTFSIPLHELQVSGAANPITGSDIVASISIEGTLGDGLVCGDADGEVTVPTTIALTGSRFEAVEIEPGTPTQDLPLPDDIGCP